MWWRRCTSPLTGSTASGAALQEIVRAVHAALGRRLLVLLDSHCCSPVRVRSRSIAAWRYASVTARASCCTASAGMARGANGNRQHQFVLDQRRAGRAAPGQHHLGVAVAVELRQLALVARQQHARALVHRPLEIARGSAGTPAAARRRARCQRRPARRVGRSPRCATRPAPAPSLSWSSTRGNAARIELCLRATPRSRASAGTASKRCRCPARRQGRVSDSGCAVCRPRRAAPATKTMDNTADRLRRCQKMSGKTTQNADSGHSCSASTSRYRRALLERLGLPFDVAAPERRRSAAARRDAAPRRRCGSPRRRRAPSRPGTRTRSSSARTRWPTATASRSASPATTPTRGRAARARCRAGRSCSTPAVALVDARERRVQTALRRRAQHVSRAVAARRSSVTCDREQPYDCAGREVRSARHRAVRAHRQRRSDRADRPAADRARRHAARRGRRRARGPTRVNDRPLYLVPNLLGVVAAGGRAARAHDRRSRAASSHWVVETPKPARAFLKSHRRRRARSPSSSIAAAVRRPAADGSRRAARAGAAGHDVGLLSDAGCPGVADPGAVARRRRARGAACASCRSSVRRRSCSR